MQEIRRLFTVTPKPRSPQHVESDDIYPVHMLDDTGTLRSIVVAWTLCFNDVLDADKLHVSLSKLLNIGDWRKIGGRLRLKDNGQLEIHVPRPFTDERPAVTFTHQTQAMDLEDHPLGKDLPKATVTPFIYPGPQTFRSLAVAENAPETLQDFIYTDAPQLSLYIISFNNATLVTLAWPHTLMDVIGQQALLRGWSLVLSGQEADVPPVLGAREDAIYRTVDASMEEQEEYRLAWKRLKGFAIVAFGLRFAVDLLWNRVVETRTIFLPKEFMAELCRKAKNDLSAQGLSTCYISEGDVLTAWITRVVASSLPQPRPIAALHALNARFRLPLLRQAPGVYIQNMAIAAFTSISAEVAIGPLGPIALENRRSITEQSTEPQVLAYLKEVSGGDPALMLYCDSTALLMPFTNWTRAHFFAEANFSHAVLRAGDLRESRKNRPGTLVFHHAQSMRPNSSARNVIVILGKDHDENYWITSTLLPAAWAKIEEQMGKT